MIIWAQTKGGVANPVRTASNLLTGQCYLDILCADWVATKKGRKTVKDGTDRRLYYSDGKLAAMLWLDPIIDREPVTPPKSKGAKA
jgi:hypothetical protein